MESVFNMYICRVLESIREGIWFVVYPFSNLRSRDEERNNFGYRTAKEKQ